MSRTVSAPADADAGAAKDAGKKSKKKSGKKISKKRIALYISLGLVAFIVWFGFQPLRGTIHVGICRTFIEFQLTFPSSLRLTEVENFDRSLRLWYSYPGSFGEIRSSMIECKFHPDVPGQVPQLEMAAINRQPLDQTVVENFNKTIPWVVAAEPSTLLPRPLEKALNIEIERENWLIDTIGGRKR